MKRLLLILTMALFLSSAPLMASPAATGNAPAREVVAAATGGNGYIMLSAGNNDAVFHIYAITGQLLKTVRLGNDSHTTIEMPQGFYVVRCNGQWSRKVVVK